MWRGCNEKSFCDRVCTLTNPIVPTTVPTHGDKSAAPLYPLSARPHSTGTRMHACTCTIAGMKYQGRTILTHMAHAVALCAAGSLLIMGLAACGNQTSSTVTKAHSDTSNSSVSSPSKPQKKQHAQSSKIQQHTKPEKAQEHSVLGTSRSATSSPSPTPSSKMCRASELTARLSEGAGAGAGSQYPYLVLTNTGTRTCIERGFPGVSLQANGTQIGAAANRDASIAPRTLHLKPGQSAYSELAIVNAANYPSAHCSPQQADSMVVYPPDQRESIRIPTSQFTGCASRDNTILTVRALQAGRGE